MILGIGCDILEIARLEKLVEKKEKVVSKKANLKKKNKEKDFER